MINEVRQALMDQLARLQDTNLNLDKEMMRAEGIVNVSKTMIESIKVEVDYMKVSGSGGTGVIPFVPKQMAQLKYNQEALKELGDGSNR